MSEAFIQKDISYLHIKSWQDLNPNLRVGFTTRNGGYSKGSFQSLNMGLHVSDDYDDCLNNRQQLANKIEFPLNDWVSGEQIHSNQVKEIGIPDKGKGAVSYQDALKGIDGMITNQAGILCTAFFADCVPLFFFDPVSNYIGIAHAGWKGSVNRIAEKMVLKLQHSGVDIANLLVAIGPCISEESYEVDEHVISHIPNELAEKTAVKTKHHHYLLDLKQLNVEILLQCGILRNNIEVTNFCTLRDESLFFSHRRDKGKTGRMLGYIGYKP
ncbi:peptidoglycan editing factor PgeF [Virgibacillus oceani]|uniref:Purine nucleoside phosphorylase n=1 Tax=Virgibacillus oceani TaxID=1479511 RepID=A0A917H788_9BACI|nr:peptidoglycan editing factor PgeF [Virgibacillus oceani]GGG69693.1 laccase domain protein [Virgibacillus oceani]